MDIVFYPTTQCENYSVFPIPSRKPDSLESYVKVGCRHCSVCDAERIEMKRKKWRSRLFEMCMYYQENGDRVVFSTFTVHDSDYPDYVELKSRLKKLTHAMRSRLLREYGDSRIVKYWFVLEHGKKTGRIHAHALFFVDKSVEWKPLWAWMKEYWTKRYDAYIFDSKLVVGTKMAINYCTKYGTKQTGYRSDRTLTSQFGWIKFMDGRKKTWLGLSQDSEGAESLFAFRLLGKRRMDDALRRDDGVAAVDAFRKLRVQVLGEVDFDRPVLHPFSGCIIDNYKWRNFKCNLERLNQGDTETHLIPDSLIWVCGKSKLSELIHLHSAKLLRVVASRLAS